MTASLDEMYEEVLRGEFSSRGKHAAAGAAPAPVPPLTEDAPARGAIWRLSTRRSTTNSMCRRRRRLPKQVLAEGEGPRGLARYRNAAMVGAGGLACAAVGAFLGGLGGYFTIAPAAAHPLASSVTQDGIAVCQRYDGGAATTSGTQAVVAAALTSLSGSLTQNALPLQWLTSQSGSLPETTAATLADLPGGGTTGAGSGDGAVDGADAAATGSVCAVTTDLGLGCVLGNVTTALGNVGTLPSDPTEELSSLVPSLTGVVTDVTGTLANLSSLLPISSLPLPAGGIPSLGLPAIAGVPGLGGLGGLGTLGSGLPGSEWTHQHLALGQRTGSPHCSPAPPGPVRPHSAPGGSGSLGAGPARPARDGFGRRQDVDPGGKRLGERTERQTTATSTSSTTTTTPTTTTVTVPIPSLPVPVSAPPVTVGGHFRRGEQRWLGLRLDALPPVGRLPDVHGPPIACGSAGRVHCAGVTGQEVPWSGSPACFVARTDSHQPRFTPTGRRCTAR